MLHIPILEWCHKKIESCNFDHAAELVLRAKKNHPGPI